MSQNEVFDIIWGARKAELVYCLVKLGVFEQLKPGPLSSAEIAAKIGFHEDNLARALRMAGALKIVDFDIGSKKYSLNNLSRSLTGETGLGSMVLWQLSVPVKRAWGELEIAITSGVQPFQAAFGVPLFQYLETHPQEHSYFNNAMTSISANQSFFGENLQKSYPFSGFKKITDVGGGHGSLVASILRAHPEAYGVVADLESVVKGGAPKLESEYADLKDRLRFEPCDFFVSVPSGGDVYILKAIIHDWNDENAVKILKVVHTAMPDHAKVVLIDIAIDDNIPNALHATLDVHMMVALDGKERTEKEFKIIFEKSGFKLTTVVPIPGSPFSVIEAVKQ